MKMPKIKSNLYGNVKRQPKGLSAQDVSASVGCSASESNRRWANRCIERRRRQQADRGRRCVWRYQRADFAFGHVLPNFREVRGGDGHAASGEQGWTLERNVVSDRQEVGRAEARHGVRSAEPSGQLGRIGFGSALDRIGRIVADDANGRFDGWELDGHWIWRGLHDSWLDQWRFDSRADRFEQQRDNCGWQPEGGNCVLLGGWRQPRNHHGSGEHQAANQWVCRHRNDLPRSRHDLEGNGNRWGGGSTESGERPSLVSSRIGPL